VGGGTWHTWERRETCAGFGGKRPLGRSRCIWEDGIRMDLCEMGLGGWSGFSWLRIGASRGLL
jgi:hypothetical protein